MGVVKEKRLKRAAQSNTFEKDALPSFSFLVHVFVSTLAISTFCASMSKASGGVVEKEQSGGSSDMPPYLSSLSKAQYNAVTADPNIPLQILAGPGSGKTRVLVARVAWLILAQKIRPSDLVVVTFTNKASNEMKQRLIKLIGPERTLQLILGEVVERM